eukprot:1139322-Pelagomonas_calceolata.AAC.3
MPRAFSEGTVVSHVPMGVAMMAGMIMLVLKEALGQAQMQEHAMSSSLSSCANVRAMSGCLSKWREQRNQVERGSASTHAEDAEEQRETQCQRNAGHVAGLCQDDISTNTLVSHIYASSCQCTMYA